MEERKMDRKRMHFAGSLFRLLSHSLRWLCELIFRLQPSPHLWFSIFSAPTRQEAFLSTYTIYFLLKNAHFERGSRIWSFQFPLRDSSIVTSRSKVVIVERSVCNKLESKWDQTRWTYSLLEECETCLIKEMKQIIELGDFFNAHKYFLSSWNKNRRMCNPIII